ncbi:MAG TPA: tyrosine-type recombinase/integrase [Roseiarcus sp.]|jgi:integrase|nr:tyrosine-type recombinase/integrase [Roseiarcus sp.]
MTDKVAGRRINRLTAKTVAALAEAREKADEVRRLIRNGIDPREDRRAMQAEADIAAAKLITFDEAADQYIESHRAAWKSDKHASQWAATLRTYASPVFGKLPVSAVDTGMVMRVLKPLWSTKTETAFRVRGRIEAVLTWAKVYGYREGENPAQWRGHLDHLLPAKAKVAGVEHHAALAYDDLPDFMRDLRQRDGVAALALEFTILAASRTSETLGATWSEFDTDNALWIVQAERMKGGREHRVPLCARAVAIIEEMRTVQRGEYVFPGARRGKPLSNMAMTLALRRMGRGDIMAFAARSAIGWQSEPTIRARLPRRRLRMSTATRPRAHISAATSWRSGDG